MLKVNKMQTQKNTDPTIILAYYVIERDPSHPFSFRFHKISTTKVIINNLKAYVKLFFNFKILFLKIYKKRDFRENKRKKKKIKKFELIYVL